MKYLLTQLIILIISVILLLYFSSLSYFVPTVGESINWYNVGAVLFLLFMASQSFVSLAIFLVEKRFLYGSSEFPTYTLSLKWGVGVGLCIVVSLFLSIFNIIPLFYALLSWAIILTLIYIFKLV